MRETNPRGNEITRPFPGDTHDAARIFEEDGLPAGSPTWTDRLKRRWKSMLQWLAKGAEHACPT